METLQMKTILGIGLLILMVFVGWLYSQSHNSNQKKCLSILFTVLAVCTVPLSGGGTFLLLIALVLLVNAFTKPLFVLAQANETCSDGLNAFKRGQSYYNSNQYNDALRSFDVAVKNGLKNVDLFTSRGVCLQMLQRHQDAIDDFTKAIALDNEDCNTYYLRSISREAVGDLERGETDIQNAVLLSQRNSEFNRKYNDYARSLGYTCVGDMYSAYWRGAKGRVELARKMRR
jgi:tetratricopeptide (TPR) repeat protein